MYPDSSRTDLRRAAYHHRRGRSIGLVRRHDRARLTVSPDTEIVAVSASFLRDPRELPGHGDVNRDSRSPLKAVVFERVGAGRTAAAPIAGGRRPRRNRTAARADSLHKSRSAPARDANDREYWASGYRCPASSYRIRDATIARVLKRPHATSATVPAGSPPGLTVHETCPDSPARRTAERGFWSRAGISRRTPHRGQSRAP